MVLITPGPVNVNCKQCKQHINCPVMVHMICPVLTVSQEVDGQHGTRRLD